MSGNDYAEFQTGATVLAIFSSDAEEEYIVGSAQPASNKSAILEFEVDDVDAQYARLQKVVKQWVKPPSTSRGGLDRSTSSIRMEILSTSTPGSKPTDVELLMANLFG